MKIKHMLTLQEFNRIIRTVNYLAPINNEQLNLDSQIRCYLGQKQAWATHIMTAGQKGQALRGKELSDAIYSWDNMCRRIRELGLDCGSEAVKEFYESEYMKVDVHKWEA